MTALLKVSIVASVLLASSSAGYYYVVCLPRRDAQLDVERMLERARADDEKRAERERADDEKRAERERILSEQRELEQRQSAEKAAAQIRYQTCLSRASNNYEASWAAACKRVGDPYNSLVAKNLADCISKGQMSKKECDLIYKHFEDASPSCALPRVIATDLNADLGKARDRCLQENRAGLQ